MCTGVLLMGITLGYVLYYAVRHTDKFDSTLLTAISGAILGAAIPSWLLKDPKPETLGPIYTSYGIGLIIGFILYLLLAIIVSNKSNQAKKYFLAGSLLGYKQQ